MTKPKKKGGGVVVEPQSEVGQLDLSGGEGDAGEPANDTPEAPPPAPPPVIARAPRPKPPEEPKYLTPEDADDARFDINEEAQIQNRAAGVSIDKALKDKIDWRESNPLELFWRVREGVPGEPITIYIRRIMPQVLTYDPVRMDALQTAADLDSYIRHQCHRQSPEATYEVRFRGPKRIRASGRITLPNTLDEGNSMYRPPFNPHAPPPAQPSYANPWGQPVPFAPPPPGYQPPYGYPPPQYPVPGYGAHGAPPNGAPPPQQPPPAAAAPQAPPQAPPPPAPPPVQAQQPQQQQQQAPQPMPYPQYIQVPAAPPAPAQAPYDPALYSALAEANRRMEQTQHQIMTLQTQLASVLGAVNARDEVMFRYLPPPQSAPQPRPAPAAAPPSPPQNVMPPPPYYGPGVGGQWPPGYGMPQPPPPPPAPAPAPVAAAPAAPAPAAAAAPPATMESQFAQMNQMLTGVMGAMRMIDQFKSAIGVPAAGAAAAADDDAGSEPERAAAPVPEAPPPLKPVPVTMGDDPITMVVRNDGSADWAASVFAALPKFGGIAKEVLESFKDAQVARTNFVIAANGGMPQHRPLPPGRVIEHEEEAPVHHAPYAPPPPPPPSTPQAAGGLRVPPPPPAHANGMAPSPFAPPQ